MERLALLSEASKWKNTQGRYMLTHTPMDNLVLARKEKRKRKKTTVEA